MRANWPLARTALCVAAVIGLVLAVNGLYISMLGAGVFGGTGRGLPNIVSGPVVLGVGIVLLWIARAGGMPTNWRDLRWSAVATIAAAALAIEFVTIGFLIVGQLLALVLPILGGLFLRRRLRDRL